jgi:hypothetical protein
VEGGGGRGRWLGLTLLLTWFCVVPSEERKVIVESIVLMVMFFIFWEASNDLDLYRWSEDFKNYNKYLPIFQKKQRLTWL